MRIHVLGWSVDGSGACTAPPDYSRVLVLVALRLLILFRQIKRLSNPRARLFVVDCHCLCGDDDDSQLEDYLDEEGGKKRTSAAKQRTNVLMCPVANALL